MMLKLKLQYFGRLMRRVDSLKKTMRHHLKPVRMAIIKKSTNNNVGECVEKREPSYTATKHNLWRLVINLGIKLFWYFSRLLWKDNTWKFCGQPGNLKFDSYEERSYNWGNSGEGRKGEVRQETSSSKSGGLWECSGLNFKRLLEMDSCIHMHVPSHMHICWKDVTGEPVAS